MNTARFRQDCCPAGKNVKILQKQSELRKIPQSTASNEEYARGYAGPFQNANFGEIYLVVSINKFLFRRTLCFNTNQQLRKWLGFEKITWHSMEFQKDRSHRRYL